MENSTFRSVTFGGFAKQDVIDYIEKTAQESAQLQEKLQQENDGLRAEVQTMRDKLVEMQGWMEKLTAERNGLQAALEQETAARQELEPWKPRAEQLETEAEALRPDAEAYAKFREQIGAIECEARKRAADLEAETIGKLRQTVATFQSQYATLMETFEGSAAHVTGELRKVEVNLTQLPRALDRTGVELEALAATLEKAQSEL